MMKFKSLDPAQKFFALIFVGVGLFIVYALMCAYLVVFFAPIAHHHSAVKNLSATWSAVRQLFSLSLPLQAASLGMYGGLVKAFAASVGTIAAAVGIIYLLSLFSNNPRKKLHGNAKWSGWKEIRKNKLLEDKGIVVGKYKGKLLRFGGAEFCSLGAPTRSGKGVGVVIPNLLEWQESMVVLDVKQECFQITSKYRKEGLGQKVFLFDPFSYNTHRYNPLRYLEFDEPDIELQIQALASALYPTGNGGKDFFQLQAQAIFIAITYLLGRLEQVGLLADSFTLTTLASALQGVRIDLEDGVQLIPLQEVAETAQRMDLLTNTIYSKFLAFFDQSEAKDQFVGIKGSYDAPLKVFQDSLFEKATEENDFDFRNLRKEKITIYIGISPNNLLVARPILNLFFSQLLLVNIRQGLPDVYPELKHTVLMLMDEFTAPGRIEQYQLSTTYMAGYKLRSLIIYQNNAQLRENPPLGYGDNGASTLLQNHSCQIFYRPKESKDAEEISKRIGNITTTSLNKSRSHGKGGGGGSSSESQTARALILPQEIMELQDNEELIFCNSAKIRCEKAFFYSDPYFINKLKSVSPSLAKIKGIPTKSQLEASYTRGETSVELPNHAQSEDLL